MSGFVTISGVSKSYKKGVPVLLPLDLEIRKGEIFFLLGPSGCGKSTLLRIIAGLLEPTEGKILLDGEDITKRPPEKRECAMVFQNYALWPHMTVFENVAFGLRARKVPSPVLREKVLDALKLVHMEEFAERKIPFLSGGQQQRVALARAVVISPKVLLLDEPLSNLDAKLRDEMRLEIARICHERDLTAIYVTHDRREALSMGDRIALLDKGVIQQLASGLELYKHPRNRFAASFLGRSNFVEGEVLEDGRIRTSFGIFRTDAKIPQGRKTVTMLFRPEQLRIRESFCTGEENTFEAFYESGMFLGNSSEMIFRTGSGDRLETESSVFEFREKEQSVSLQIRKEEIAILED